MSDQTAPDVEPTDLPTALLELRHARAEVERLRPFVDMVDKAQRDAEAAEQQGPLLALAAREKAVRDHTLNLHVIGEQISQIESWFWAHLADLREAARRRISGPLPDDVVAACVHPAGYEDECPCPPDCACCKVTARTTPDIPATSTDTQDSPLRARIQALADEHPVAIPTHLIDEALDQTTAAPAAAQPDTRYAQAIADVQSSGPAARHNDGPSIAEAAADDRTWDLRKAGE